MCLTELLVQCACQRRIACQPPQPIENRRPFFIEVFGGAGELRHFSRQVSEYWQYPGLRFTTSSKWIHTLKERAATKQPIKTTICRGKGLGSVDPVYHGFNDNKDGAVSLPDRNPRASNKTLAERGGFVSRLFQTELALTHVGMLFVINTHSRFEEPSMFWRVSDAA